MKPARSGSSFGVSRVDRREELPSAVEAARQYDSKVLIEEAVVGGEVGCAILGNETELIAGEPDRVALSHGFFRIHQEDEPESGSENATFIVPADISTEARELVQETAKALYRALGCGGLARVDMFLKEDGTVVLNEVNTLPGLTSYSRYPRMMAAAGLSLGRGDRPDRVVGIERSNDDAPTTSSLLTSSYPEYVGMRSTPHGTTSPAGPSTDIWQIESSARRALCAALRTAREAAASLGFGLLLWDGYRPQRAVDCFLRWSKQPEDGRTKQRHYPNIDRPEMFDEGYVAARSGHSRGSAVDLTLFHLATGCTRSDGRRP